MDGTADARIPRRLGCDGGRASRSRRVPPWFEHHKLNIFDEYLATIADWDAYEGPWAANLETYAHAHPDDPESGEMLAWANEARTRRRLGPGVLGFALVLAGVAE